jgi:hypothetical protein
MRSRAGQRNVAGLISSGHLDDAIDGEVLSLVHLDLTRPEQLELNVGPSLTTPRSAPDGS